MKKTRFVSVLHDLIMGEELDNKHKLQNMLLATSIIGCGISSVISLFSDRSLASKLLPLFCFIMLLVTFYVSTVRRKQKAGTLMVFISINLIFFPLMFFCNGGVYSGMPIWLIFGLIYPWLVSEGALCVVMFALNMLAALVCFGAQFFFP